MQKNLNDYTDNELLQIANDSTSFYNFLTKLNLRINGSTDYGYYRNYFQNRNVKLFFNGQKIKNKLKLDEFGKIIKRYNNEEMFKINSTINRSSVKQRLLKEKLIPYVCKDCGNTGEWNSKTLVLQLEHKNGIRDDNRIENLCFLCPNCHTQTSTYSSKNTAYKTICKCGNKKDKSSLNCIICENVKRKQKTEFIPKNILINEVTKNGYVQTGKKYGVSDNTIRYWVKSYGLDPKTIKNAL